MYVKKIWFFPPECLNGDVDFQKGSIAPCIRTSKSWILPALTVFRNGTRAATGHAAHLPVMQVFSVHCKYKASKQHNKDSLKPILKPEKNYTPYFSREIILNSILYWGVNEWCKQMSSQQTLQWFAHWLVALCFWLLMRNLWELKKRGHGFSKRSPLLKRTLCGIGRSVPLVACDMVFWNGKVGYFR